MYTGGISNSSLSNKALGWLESCQAYNDVFGRGGIKNTLLKVLSKAKQYIGKKETS
jgi:hypothetical protein